MQTFSCFTLPDRLTPHDKNPEVIMSLSQLKKLNIEHFHRVLVCRLNLHRSADE